MIPGTQREQIESACSQLGLRPRVFVETGTLLGDTTAIAMEMFERVITIELSDDLYAKAKERFAGTNVECWHFDSAKLVPRLARNEITESALWLLDAHWFVASDKHDYKDQVAKDHPFPLWDELTALRERPCQDVIIVDDTHCADGKQKRTWLERNTGVTPDAIVKFMMPQQHVRLIDSLAMLTRGINK